MFVLPNKKAMKTARSIGAVVAGIMTNVILSVAVDFVLESTGIFPPVGEGKFDTWMLVLALSYRCVFAVAGGYVTARLAPKEPMRHVIILACIGIALGIIGTIVGWNKSAHWYPLALVITAFPCTWLGGKLSKTKKQH
jgi:hypothetical protein